MASAEKSENRFEKDAERYATYLETPEGRLRADLAFANVQELLPVTTGERPLRALDLGCGTGTTAIRMARLGIHVTLLDSSASMLALAEHAAVEAGIRDRVTVKHREAPNLAEVFPGESFDIVLCHNLLEYVEDPGEVLCGAARVLRDSAGVLSVLVRNQAGDVMKAALRAGDLAAAESTLTAEWGQETLYGGKVRLFTPGLLEAILKDAGLIIRARRGVRVVADYLPSQIARAGEYERIFALERRLGERGEFFGIARYLQCFAIRAGARLEGKR